jgi:hypothetical protein
VKPAALVALAIFSVLLGLVSARLLRLALRTRRSPELLLGLSTSLPLTSYVIGFVGAAVGQGTPARWVTEVAGSICDLGFVATIGFVWVVFRWEERWAKILATVLALGLLAMPLVNHYVPWDGGVPSAMVPRTILRTSCYAWAAIESLQYARLMRRRVRFGLAEPIVADRFQLWGFAHICLALTLLLIMVGVNLHLSGADFARLCTFLGFSLGLLAAVPLTLSFFPPDRYVEHIEKHYRQQVAS